MNTRFRKSQIGMSLIEVILGAAVVAITAVSIPQVMKLMQHNSAQSQAIRVSVTERTKIEALLKNHAAWTQTMQKNPSFACGINASGCSLNSGNNGYYNFVLYGSEPNEKLTYDPSDPTTRVTLQGLRCPAGVPDPSERCPIRFQAMWKPVCATYPCVNPTLEIKIALSTKYGSGANDVIPINVEKYSHSAVRSFNEDDIQSACLMLNGIYNSINNTCFPPHAGRNCAALGRPAQVVTGVDADGNITCSPFYHNSCNPTTQMMTGISATGAAICSPKPPPTPVIDCVGNWGACSAACNGGTQTYTVTTPESGGGVACPFATGATQACNTNPCPVNCVGSWQTCTQPCGGGTSTFVVTTAAANGGTACTANHGDVMACNTQACGVPVDCAGTWSACDPNSGTQTFTMTQAAQNGGAACPASPRTCAVDCVGNWGACNAGTKTYTWSVTPKNGGATCAYANGSTDSCLLPLGCMCRWPWNPWATAFYSQTDYKGSGSLATCNANKAAMGLGSEWKCVGASDPYAPPPPDCYILVRPGPPTPAWVDTAPYCDSEWDDGLVEIEASCQMKGPGSLDKETHKGCEVVVHLKGDSGIVNAKFMLNVDPAKYSVTWTGDCVGSGVSCTNNSYTVNDSKPIRDYDVYWSATYLSTGKVQTGHIPASYTAK